jgi:hypothetical protein
LSFLGLLEGGQRSPGAGEAVGVPLGFCELGSTVVVELTYAACAAVLKVGHLTIWHCRRRHHMEVGL